MNHIWTLVFVILLFVGFSLAGWQDRKEARRREQRRAASAKMNRPAG